MTDQEEVKTEETKKKTPKPYKKMAQSKPRSNDSCECPEGPTRESITKIAGMTGEMCGVCLSVLNWKFDTPEKKEKEPKQSKIDLKSEKKKTKNSGEYPVIKVLGINNKTDHMEFVCVTEEKMFSVTVPSTVEKVNAALAKPALIVGKIAFIDHDGVDSKGVPINPVVTAVRPKK